MVFIASIKLHYKNLGMANFAFISFFILKKHTRKNVLLSVLDLIGLIGENRCSSRPD